MITKIKDRIVGRSIKLHAVGKDACTEYEGTIGTITYINYQRLEIFVTHCDRSNMVGCNLSFDISRECWGFTYNDLEWDEEKN